MAILRRALAWDYGVLAVQSLGGMLGPVLFPLPDGRTVSPLQVAPWANEPGAEALPPILRALRGEWSCVPFGFDAERALTPGWQIAGESFAGAEVPHGHGANARWTFLDGPSDRLILECLYPADHPVRGLRRTIRPDPKAPAIEPDSGDLGAAALPAVGAAGIRCPRARALPRGPQLPRYAGARRSPVHRERDVHRA
ncbi:hypothetical protein [Methylobacterium sp. DCY52]|uniref:hypothetical protein n=1 Tax=Methylobacterium sp. DCY52 TaxID=739139 RepID=UPI00314512A2